MVEDLIYDVGMNDGADTAYYLFKGYRVVAIEANPLYTALAHKRFKTAVRSGRLILLNIGIGPRRETATFWVNEHESRFSSFLREQCQLGGTPYHPIQIQCQRLRDVFEEYGVPFYLKIDIEGHEQFCLEDISPDDAPVYVSCEAHSLDELRRLSACGYTAYKLVDQYTHSPTPSPDGRLSSRAWRRLGRILRRHVWTAAGAGPDGKWVFPPGSSGPFGEDTPGPWMSFEEVAQRFSERTYYAWLDFHAKRG